MNEALKRMIAQRPCSTKQECTSGLKEIIQEIVLLGLSRGKFFEHAAFYGGTALRLFYGLDRFSEDIDFSLLRTDDSFDLGRYCSLVKEELSLYGFKVEVEKKRKKTVRKVESAFVKANTLWHLLNITGIEHTESGIHAEELLKVKFEVDTDPPPGAGYEVRFLYHPLPFSVKLFDPPSLFAGKMHAFLFRNMQGKRVKGRDIYDVVWLAAREIPLNVRHLEERMKQSGNWGNPEHITEESFRALFTRRIHSLDLDAARADVRGFLADPRALDVWSIDFFDDVVKRIRLV